MLSWAAVAAGGALGSALRHGVNTFFSRYGHPVPYATAAVNVVGCAVIGVLAGLLATGNLRLEPATRTFVFVGILGGFTTFSSLGLDTLTLMHGGQPVRAFANLAFQLVFGIGAAFAGYALAAGK